MERLEAHENPAFVPDGITANGTPNDEVILITANFIFYNQSYISASCNQSPTPERSMGKRYRVSTVLYSNVSRSWKCLEIPISSS